MYIPDILCNLAQQDVPCNAAFHVMRQDVLSDCRCKMWVGIQRSGDDLIVGAGLYHGIFIRTTVYFKQSYNIVSSACTSGVEDDQKMTQAGLSHHLNVPHIVKLSVCCCAVVEDVIQLAF